MLAFIFVCSLAHSQTSIIPQIVDGGAWLTTIAVTNTGSSQEIVGLTFFQETGGGNTSSWGLAFAEGSAASLVLQPASTTFLHSFGTAATTIIGWGQVQELDGTGSVKAYAIFTQRVPGRTDQDGTAPAAAAVSRILVPFDNTSGAVTSMAVANTTSSSETINVGIRTASGTSQPSAITLPANGHSSFTFPTQFTATAGQSGLAEFYAPSGSFSILALKFNSGAFTTAPVYSVTGPPIIASSSSGGGNTSGNINFAGFSVGLLNSTGGSFPTTGSVTQIAGGQFASYTPAEWNLPFAAQMFGSCGVLDVTYPSSGKAPYAADSFLDAGDIAISGAGISAGSTLRKLAGPTGPVYSFVGPSGSIQPGQAYTISSTGGAQINAFSTTAAVLPTTFAVTNWDSITAINRSGGLTINWTGTGFDQVIISMTGTTIGANIHAVTISCAVPASTGTFSVPQEALSMLPAVQSGSPAGAGVLSVTVGTTADGQITGVSTTSKSFTPTLVTTVAPIDYGSFTSFLAVAKSLSIQ